MNSKFELIFRDISDFEHLVVQINYNGQILCYLNKESGQENIRIMFFPDSYILDEEIVMHFELKDFLEVIEIAKKELLLCP